MSYFLNKQIEKIENQLIEWCKKTKYDQGDSYNVRITKKGLWAVSYSNDYPMQHGSGREWILTQNEFIEATSK